MKVARFVAASKELFYFVSSMMMMRRYCETIEDAERIIAGTDVNQTLVQV